MEYLPGIGRTEACQGCNACDVEIRRDISEADLVQEVVRRVLTEVSGASAGTRIPVGVSVRHIHITQKDLEILYGPGSRLTKLRDLYQPGEFASEEVVAVVGPRMRSIQNVRILGPLRNVTQVELSRTDGIQLGLDLPVRESGKLQGSCPIVLIGPHGSLHLKEGAIRANRHIHLSPDTAEALRVRNGQLVRAQTRGEMGVVFTNVMIRVGEGLKLQMHIDTDDANAAGIRCDDTVEIIE